MCVYGDGQHWLTSYYALNSSQEAYERRCLETACRNAIRSSRDEFLANHPGLEADHANPGGFKAILQAFISKHGTPGRILNGAQRMVSQPGRSNYVQEVP